MWLAAEGGWALDRVVAADPGPGASFTPLFGPPPHRQPHACLCYTAPLWAQLQDGASAGHSITRCCRRERAGWAVLPWSLFSSRSWPSRATQLQWLGAIVYMFVLSASCTSWLQGPWMLGRWERVRCFTCRVGRTAASQGGRWSEGWESRPWRSELPRHQGSGLRCCGRGYAAVQGPSSCTTAACGEAATSHNLHKAASTCKPLQCPGQLAGAAAPAGSQRTLSNCVA